MPSSEIRELSLELAPEEVHRLHRRQGVVVSIQGSSATIRLGGSTTNVAGIRHLGSYTPVVGHTVWVLVDGPDMLILGSLVQQSGGGGGGGASPSGFVVTETSFGQAAAAGSGAEYSRGDHTHGTPAAPGGATPYGFVAGETLFGLSASAGSVAAYSRGDHTHGTPAHGYINHAAVPSASVYRDTALTVGNAVETTVSAFTGARWDNASMWDGVGLLVAPVTGLYLLAGSVFWVTNSTGQRVLHLKINDTLTIIDDHQMAHADQVGPGMSACRPYRLNAGDNFRMTVLQQSGANLDLAGGSSAFGMEMSMTWMST